MRNQSPSAPRQDFVGEVVIVLLVIVLVLLLCPAIVGGWMLARFIRQSAYQRILQWSIGILAALSLLFIYFFANPLTQTTQPLRVLGNDFFKELSALHFQPLTLLGNLLAVWLFSLALIPLVTTGVTFFFSATSSRYTLKKSPQTAKTTLKKSEKNVPEIDIWQVPDYANRERVLGLLKGNIVNRAKERWFTLSHLEKHVAIVGESGSGKTETILRIAIHAAHTLRWQVVYMSGKEDQEFAERFVALMSKPGTLQVKRFPSEKYDGWSGDIQTHLQRLLTISTSNEELLSADVEKVLELALHSSPTPPFDSTQFLSRLSPPVLYEHYKVPIDGKASPQELSPEATFLQHLPLRIVTAIYTDYRAFFKSIDGKLDGEWTFETADLACVQLNGLEQSGNASRVGRYLLEDFVHYATTSRKKRGILFIFDDLDAVDIDLSPFFQRIRPHAVATILSSQTLEALDRRTAGVALDAYTRVLHKSDASAALAMSNAGKDKRFTQETLRTLPTGEAIILTEGKAHHVRIAPAKKLSVQPGVQQGDALPKF